MPEPTRASTDAVILWNTVRYAEIIDGLRAEGFPASDEDIAHLSPTRYGHVDPYGRYRFDLGADPGNGRDGTHHDPQPRGQPPDQWEAVTD